MIKKKNQRRLAFICSFVLSVGMFMEYKVPNMTAYAYTVRSATVQASTLNVRSGPGTTNSIVAKLGKGSSVSVIGEKTASDGALWYEIRFVDTGGATKTGYVSKSYIKFPVSYNTDQAFEAHLNEQRFPESYKEGLRQLHAQYPNWIFKAQHTNLDWETVIENESIVGRNLVPNTSVSSWKSTATGAYNWDTSTWPAFDSGGWVAASDGIVRHYMDPRNFLDNTYVFQFLLHSYDSSKHTKDGLMQIIQGTFLSGSTAADQSQASESTDSSQLPDGSSNNSNPSSGGEIGPGVNLGPGGGSNPGTQPADDTPDTNTGEVSLEGPQASISRKERFFLMSNVTIGEAPGADTGTGNSNSGNQTTGPSASGDSTGPTASGNNTGPSVSDNNNSTDSGNVSISGASYYADMIMNAAVQTGVNPYVIAAMIIQEQGQQGTGNSISGNYSGYAGYYNFFNIEAYQSSSMSAVQRGLWYASQSGNYMRPWNSREKSIIGGAMFYSQNYVKAGQDTFYLKKFNVQGENLYKHQYMTNVQAAASESAIYAQAYTEQLRTTALEFKIPVFLNMPESASPLPMLNGSPNNKLSALRVDGYSLTPTFNRDTTAYDVIVDQSVSQIQIVATALDSGATISGAGTVTLASGNNQITISVTAKNGTVRTYTINVVRQGNSSGETATPPVSGSGNSGNASGPGAGSGNSQPSDPAGSTSTPGGSNVTIIG